MNFIENMVGDICEVVLPIPENIYKGNSGSNVAICTLSSLNLLREIAKSGLMEKIAIVGRLLSENKGIDSLIKNINSKNNIKTLILCGKDVWGHKAGSSLIALHNNGVDKNGKIIKSESPHPILFSTPSEISKFRETVQIIDKIGETDFQKIQNLVKKIKT